MMKIVGEIKVKFEKKIKLKSWGMENIRMLELLGKGILNELGVLIGNFKLNYSQPSQRNIFGFRFRNLLLGYTPILF